MSGEQGGGGAGAATAGLTRGDVAGILGIAVASVRRLESSRLHPVRGSDGVWRFKRAEVEALAAERKGASAALASRTGLDEGDLAAAAFELFEQGKPFSAIVRELHQPPAAIRQLHREWAAGFEGIDDETGDSDDDLEAYRERDERELLAWEKRMFDLQERHEELERRDRLELADRRFARSGRRAAGR